MSRPRNLAFQTLRHRDFRLLWAADTVSMFGAQLQRVAIAYHVYVLTNDPLQLGLIGLFRFAPVLLFGIVGGVIADQQDRRKVLVASHIALMATSAVLAAATYADQVSIPLIYGITFVSTTFNAVAGPARQAIIPSLVPRAELAGAATIANLSMQVAGVVGPAAGGVIIGIIGIGAVYAIDAVSFLAVIVAVVVMRVRTAPMQLGTGGFAAAKEGLAFLWATPILLAVMALDFVATFFGQSNTLMPIFAEEILDIGASGLGLLLSAIAAGAVIGGLVMSVLPIPTRPGRAILIAVAAYGACILGFGLSTRLELSLLFLAGSGAADAVSMAMRHAIRNLVTPDEYRGRIAAAHSTFASGGPQLGEFEAGAVASLIGTPGSVVTGGIATILAALAAMRIVPSLGKYDSSSWADEAPEPTGKPARAAEKP